MKYRIASKAAFLVVAAAVFVTKIQVANAEFILVADRLSNSVYRYSDSGTLLGTVLADNLTLDQPTGIAVSPDRSKLYISSFQNSRVVQYDYNAIAGTASNPQIIAQGVAGGLSTPSAILFNPDGSKFYVSNLGGTGVAQFNADGTSAGPAINGSVAGGSIFQFSGLAWAPDNSLLVGGFLDSPAGVNGAVAKSDAAVASLTDFIGPLPSLSGASGLLVNGNDLYVSSMFASNVQRFDLTTGNLDPTFSISGLAFPQQLMAAPDGNGLLVGILGFTNGQGSIARYDFDGSFIDTFASPGGGGFTEATAFTFVAVPEPSSIATAIVGLLVCILVPARKRLLRVIASCFYEVHPC